MCAPQSTLGSKGLIGFIICHLHEAISLAYFITLIYRKVLLNFTECKGKVKNILKLKMDKLETNWLALLRAKGLNVKSNLVALMTMRVH